MPGPCLESTGRAGARLRVSDYVVEADTDFELVNGQIREAAHAGPLHSEQLNQVSYVLGACVTRGHGVDVDLLTRQDENNNFSGDISIRKKGIDPDTEDRYLEELVFEIRHTVDPDDLAYRARIMAACGVRRIFAIPVLGDAAGSEIIPGPVAEWMPAEERWRTYRDDELIADPCLLQPLPVRALLDPLEADNAVARALLAKRSPVLMAHFDACYRAELESGEKAAARELIYTFVQSRGIAMDAAAHARIAACSDLAVLKRWVLRAAHATSASDLFGDD